jgi:hypothetical protein
MPQWAQISSQVRSLDLQVFSSVAHRALVSTSSAFISAVVLLAAFVRQQRVQLFLGIDNLFVAKNSFGHRITPDC